MNLGTVVAEFCLATRSAVRQCPGRGRRPLVYSRRPPPPATTRAVGRFTRLAIGSIHRTDSVPPMARRNREPVSRRTHQMSEWIPRSTRSLPALPMLPLVSWIQTQRVYRFMPPTTAEIGRTGRALVYTKHVSSWGNPRRDMAGGNVLADGDRKWSSLQAS